MGQKPSEVFADRLSHVRRRLGMKQGDMAGRLTDMGHPTDRPTVNRMENRARTVSLDDAVAYSAALGVSLAYMVGAPLKPGGVNPIGRTEVPALAFRHWMAGMAPLPGGNESVYFWEGVPEEERPLALDDPLMFIRRNVAAGFRDFSAGDMLTAGKYFAAAGTALLDAYGTHDDDGNLLDFLPHEPDEDEGRGR